MLNRMLILVSMVWPVITCADIQVINELSHSELRSIMFDLVNKNITSHRISFKISKSHSIDAFLSGTQKGNGTLKIGNQLFRIYDEHDDGFIFKDGLIGISFADINADGHTDIVLHGIATQESEEDGKLSTISLTAIYIFQMKENKFNKVFSNSKVKLLLTD